MANQEKKQLDIINQTINFLKSYPTTVLAFHDSEEVTKAEEFYDTVINKFFATQQMFRNFQTDTMVFGVAGKFDIVRHILNSCDYYLDIVPLDSILFEPCSYYKEDERSSKSKKEHDSISNCIDVFFKIENKKIKMLACYFDKAANKLLGLSSLMMEKKDIELVKSFLRRQKNYYEYPTLQ
jgi:hypothetical protein